MNNAPNGLILMAAASSILASTSASAQSRRPVKPEAVYWLSAETSTGVGADLAALSKNVSPAALAAGAGAPEGRSGSHEAEETKRGGLGGLRSRAIGRIGSVFGGSLGGRRKKAAPAPEVQEAEEELASSYSRSLMLQLGTSRLSPAAPAAEHLVPAGLKTSSSLPLLTPRNVNSVGEVVVGDSGVAGRSQGKMMIYWGCGDKAIAAPIIIDLAKLGTRGSASVPLLALRRESPPAEGSSTTYGHWPNERSRQPVPAGGSLVGAHRIRGNYTPNIDFALNPSQDFLAPLVLNAETKTPAGGRKLTWNAVPHAIGYFAQLLGTTSNDTVVIWSSSAKALSQSELMDYVAEGEVRRLVSQGYVLPAATTNCTVPAEVVRAVPDSMLQMIAYGSEANIASPVQTAGAKAVAGPGWAVKLRRKSTATALLD